MNAFKKYLQNRPMLVGIIFATILFLLFIPNVLKTLSPMGWSYAYDYFTLPRCGLAIRMGTNPFDCHIDYKNYGYFSTWWVSHPGLCVVLGAPLSYLPPWHGFWFTTFLYYLLHLFIIIQFGKKLIAINGRWFWYDYLVFAAFGFYFPWYTMYILGQYHALVVLAVALILTSEKYIIHGFVISAIGKPVLAPAAILLLIQKKWKEILYIGIFCVIFYIPFIFFNYEVNTGLTFGLNTSFLKFLTSSSMLMKQSVFHWNQEMSWSKVFDEILPYTQHYYIRLGLATITLFVAILLAFQNKLKLAIGISILWFFFLYARGHEYHHTLYLPLLAFLYCEGNERYRRPWFLLPTLLCALPTVFPLFLYTYGYTNPGEASSDKMIGVNQPLYWIFLLQHPIVAPILLTALSLIEFKKKAPLSLEQSGHSTSLP